MDTVSAISAIIGMFGFLFGTINLIYPIKRLGIATRKRATVALVISLGLVILGTALLDLGKKPEQANRDVAKMQGAELVRSDETGHRSDGSATRDIGNVESAPRAREEHEATSDVTVPNRAGSSETNVVSDRFILQWDLAGTDLLLAINTDLPDAAEVIVSVDRRYYEVGNTEAYSRSYFSEKGRISKWRTPRRVPINDEIWKADLKAHQSKMATLYSDLAFEIDRIEDQISVRAVVHVNQPDSRFGGRGNPNLSGAAVSRMSGSNNWNLVEDQQEIRLPLTGVRQAKRARNVPHDGLRKGESYRLLSESPLMAAGPNSVSGSNPEEIMKVLGKTLNIPAGRVVRVVSIDRSSGSNPWYEVEVIGNEGATGWINSTALMRSGVVLE